MSIIELVLYLKGGGILGDLEKRIRDLEKEVRDLRVGELCMAIGVIVSYVLIYICNIA